MLEGIVDGPVIQKTGNEISQCCGQCRPKWGVEHAHINHDWFIGHGDDGIGDNGEQKKAGQVAVGRYKCHDQGGRQDDGSCDEEKPSPGVFGFHTRILSKIRKCK